MQMWTTVYTYRPWLLKSIKQTFLSNCYNIILAKFVMSCSIEHEPPESHAEHALVPLTSPELARGEHYYNLLILLLINTLAV